MLWIIDIKDSKYIYKRWQNQQIKNLQKQY